MLQGIGAGFVPQTLDVRSTYVWAQQLVGTLRCNGATRWEPLLVCDG